MGERIWTKFSVLARLVCITFGWVVLSPSPPPGRPLPAPCPFPWSGAGKWSLVLPRSVIPFWKAVVKPNNSGRADFWFCGWGPISGLQGWGHLRGGIFMRICQFFIKHTPPKISFLEMHIFVFWFEAPLMEPRGWVVSVIMSFGKCWLTFEWLGQ